jgi:hypothetical protein
MGSCIGFKGSFHFNFFVRGNSLLEVYLAEMACMVNKNGVAPYLFLVSLPLSCAMNPDVRDSSWSTEMQLLGEVASYSDFVFVLNSFHPPELLGHCSVHTTSTFLGPLL